MRTAACSKGVLENMGLAHRCLAWISFPNTFLMLRMHKCNFHRLAGEQTVKSKGKGRAALERAQLRF